MRMKRSIVAFSSNTDANAALFECISQINQAYAEPKLLIYFSSPEPFIFYTEELKKSFPTATTIGAMNYVQFSSNGTAKEGLTILAIFSGIETSSGIIFEIDRHPRNYVSHIRQALHAITSFENTVCLEFMSANSKGEELVMDTFNREFKGKGINVAGGTAYADPKDGTTYVGLDGIVYKNTCVFVLIHNTNGKIFSYHENIYKQTDTVFTATDVDCEERIVYEYDNMTAAKAISEALNVSKEDIKNTFNRHPMGRVIDGKLFITAPEKLNDDDSISYFSRIYNCTKMILLDTDNFENVWENTKQNVLKEIPKPSFTIAINCFLRTDLFLHTKQFENFMEHLKDNFGTYIGLTGFGEQMDFIHLNQTLVLLTFE